MSMRCLSLLNFKAVFCLKSCPCGVKSAGFYESGHAAERIAKKLLEGAPPNFYSYIRSVRQNFKTVIHKTSYSIIFSFPLYNRGSKYNRSFKEHGLLEDDFYTGGACQILREQPVVHPTESLYYGVP